LPGGADYKVHVTAQTSQTECGTYDNTADPDHHQREQPEPVSASESCVFRVDLAITKAGFACDAGIGYGKHHLTMVVTEQRPDTDRM